MRDLYRTMRAGMAGKFFTGALTHALRPSGRILFVLGTGRSGTHFLTECLISHDEMTDLTSGQENPLVFDLVTAASIDLRRMPSLLKKAKSRYDLLSKIAHPHWFVDQSHPNIWFAEYWAAVYADARFVAIVRNPYSVVASMLKRDGVRRWVEQWERFPVPNNFLGVTEENKSRYDEMTLVERCAVRWVAHYRRVQELRPKLGAKLTVLRYEDLCLQPQTALTPIASALGLRSQFDVPAVDLSALSKAESMDAADVTAIEAILTGAGIDQEWRLPLWRRAA